MITAVVLVGVDVSGKATGFDLGIVTVNLWGRCSFKSFGTRIPIRGQTAGLAKECYWNWSSIVITSIVHSLSGWLLFQREQII